MKNKSKVIILYIIQALPIPFSLVSIIGTIISLANIGMAESVFQAIVSILAMVLAGTYIITYIISLIITSTKKKIKFYSFLPVVHMIVAIACFVLWSNL